VLTEALLKNHPHSPGGFAMSIGSQPVDGHIVQLDDDMHQAMKSRSHYAILAKKKEDIDSEFNTYASHRLEDCKESISLLEELTLNPTKKSRLYIMLNLIANFFKKC
jgi:hypothetical protein